MNSILKSKEHDSQIFEGVVLDGEVVDGLEFQSCMFKKCDFLDCDLGGTDFLECVFEDCNLRLSTFVGSSFKDVKFLNSKLVGIDTSPGMINVAKTNEANTGINFFIRSDFESLQKFDFIFEIGVINYADLDTEIKFGAENLKNDGYFVCTVAATSSLSNIFKRNPHEYNNFLSYGSYEKSFRKFFDIEKSFPVGLFIPFLWRMPLLAGFLQPFVEIILRPLVPNIFHEKIYILKKR